MIFLFLMHGTSPPASSVQRQRRSAVFGAAGPTVRGAVPPLVALTGATVRGSMMWMWIKHIIAILACGALIALGNFIYTMSSKQWQESGLPDLPPMLGKVGGGAQGPIASSSPSTVIGGARGGGVGARGVQTSFLDEYRD